VRYGERHRAIDDGSELSFGRRMDEDVSNHGGSSSVAEKNLPPLRHVIVDLDQR
jgi:hypothetical protein